MAITPYHFLEGGAGLGDGSSWANAFDLTQANLAAATGAGKLARFSNAQGNLTVPANLATTAGTTANTYMVGYNDAMTAIATDWTDCPVFDFASSYNITINSQTMTHGIKMINANNDCVTTSGTYFFSGVWVDAAGGVGFNINQIYSTLLFCRASNNGNNGFDVTNRNLLLGCESYGNSGYGFKGNGQNKYALCYGRDNASGGINNATQEATVLCTFDANANAGAYVNGSNLSNSFFGNLFTNHDSAGEYGIEALNDLHMLLFNNFYNNNTDITLAGDQGPTASTTADPDYVDIANNDYQVQEATLQEVLLFTKVLPNLGASMKGAAAAGGGGLPPFFGHREV
jgi:hypothetical protein